MPAGVTRRSRARGSLVVVGIGIGGPSQTTPEAVASMQGAEQLYYLVTNPVAEVWVRSLNRTATSLHDLYELGKPREETYEAMTRRIAAAALEGKRVCAAFYGHPGVLVHASHAAMRRVRRAGLPARMLPAVSAEACLYADLGLNPGDCGVQSYEATEYLLSRRKADPTSELILWQIGVVGETLTRRLGAPFDPARMEVLVQRLRRSYPALHRVVVYEAATVPWHRPVIRRVALERLPQIRITPTATLYVPALPRARWDRTVIRWFEEDRRRRAAP